MAAAWYRAKRELRSRWRATLLLAILVGVVGGAVLTTAAGARRASTAYDRFRSETLASDLDVAFDDPPGGSIEGAAAAVEALPQVAALGRSDFPFIIPEGSGAYPYLDFLAAVSVDGADEPQVDRPRIVDGRLPDPRAADEMAISETYATESGLRVGDRAAFDSYAPEQLEPLFTSGDAGEPAGPHVTLLVTAVFDAPTFLSESAGDFQPRVILSPAFVDEHGEDIATYPGGFTLRLKGGSADAADVTATLRTMFPDTELEITPASETDRKIDSGIAVIVTALALCALVATLAGGVAVGQALSRHFDVQMAGDRWVAALGMTRFDRVATQVITTVPVAVLGAVAAVGVSVAASPLLPVGIARRAEPDPGIAIDATVVVLGFIGIVVGVVLLSVLAAMTIVRRERLNQGDGASAPPSRSMMALRRTDLAPQVTIGVGLAIAPRSGTRIAVRSAFLGAALGVVGVVALVVFLASVDRLANSPAQYGSPFDASVSGFSGDVLDEGDVDILGDPTVARVGLGSGGLAQIAGVEVNTYALESVRGNMSFTLLDGRAPTGRAEVALGAETLEAAGVGIGDDVVVEGAGGTLRATVVGTAVFPVTDERSAPGRGVLLTREDLEAISSEDELNVDVLISWADGVDPEVANERLADATETEVFGPRLPSEVNNLREVKALPRALAVFLAILGAVAVVHALISTVRTRRQDFAVLRALGFEARQLSSAVVWEATTIAVIGIVVGVPLGVAAGGFIWRAVAHSIGVADDAATPPIALLCVAIGALLLLQVAALVPSRMARKVRAAIVLRTGV
ncbi:ABC transporter permease [Dermatobacter hominis]|uniref:ABC transporter permease n=1 Tax=Dermatobacter hominis TaxID=2884263 RepID=UPI001D1107B3|nr:FtsX-like permease family protein [Dermatobacter hominis]UDY37635.1 FtsX-like permease family protein [Dermatobacter hominis]